MLKTNVLKNENELQQPYLIHFILRPQPQYDIVQKLISQYSNQLFQQFPQYQLLNRQKQQKLFRNKQKLMSINQMSQDKQLRNKILEQIEIKQYDKLFNKIKNQKLQFYELQTKSSKQRKNFVSFNQIQNTPNQISTKSFMNGAKSSKSFRTNTSKLNSFTISKNQKNQQKNNNTVKIYQNNRASQQFNENQKVSKKIKSKCKQILSTTKLDPRLFSIFELTNKKKQTNLKRASLNDLANVYKVHNNKIQQKQDIGEQNKIKNNKQNKQKSERLPHLLEKQQNQQKIKEKSQYPNKLSSILKPYENTLQRYSFQVNSIERNKVRNSKNKQSPQISFYKPKGACDNAKYKPKLIKEVQVKDVKLSSFHYVLSEENEKIFNLKGKEEQLNAKFAGLCQMDEQQSNI